MPANVNQRLMFGWIHSRYVKSLLYVLFDLILKHVTWRRPIFHVLVSGSGCVSGCVSERFECGRPITRFSIRQTYLPGLPYYKQCLHNIVINHMNMQYLLSKMWWTVICLSYIRVILQGYDVLGADYGFEI